MLLKVYIATQTGVSGLEDPVEKAHLLSFVSEKLQCWNVSLSRGVPVDLEIGSQRKLRSIAILSFTHTAFGAKK